MADIAAATAATVEPDATLVKDHQAYFVKSAEKVNSTLHAAICKFCHAQDVEMKDNRTCLWQARDCIRHLARCPHVTEAVRTHFKEEARLLNARLNSKKRNFQEMSNKQEDNADTQYNMPSSDAQPAPPVLVLDNTAEATGQLLLHSVSPNTPALLHMSTLHVQLSMQTVFACAEAPATIASLQATLQLHAAALARLQSVLERHDRLACHAVLMTATSKLDEMMQGSHSEARKQSSLAQDVAGLSQNKLLGFRVLDGIGLSSTDVEFAQNQKVRSSIENLQEFTPQEMAEAVGRRQGPDAMAYQRLYQFAFANCLPGNP